MLLSLLCLIKDNLHLLFFLSLIFLDLGNFNFFAVLLFNQFLLDSFHLFLFWVFYLNEFFGLLSFVVEESLEVLHLANKALRNLNFFPTELFLSFFKGHCAVLGTHWSLRFWNSSWFSNIHFWLLLLRSWLWIWRSWLMNRYFNFYPTIFFGFLIYFRFNFNFFFLFSFSLSFFLFFFLFLGLWFFLSWFLFFNFRFFFGLLLYFSRFGLSFCFLLNRFCNLLGLLLSRLSLFLCLLCLNLWCFFWFSFLLSFFSFCNISLLNSTDRLLLFLLIKISLDTFNCVMTNRDAIINNLIPGVLLFFFGMKTRSHWRDAIHVINSFCNHITHVFVFFFICILLSVVIKIFYEGRI
jgi:hypothetical protein